MNKSAHITILMDNYAAKPSLLTEHGLSLWIEIGDKRILWDTGQSDGLFDNAGRLGIDIRTADVIALSHGHYDHTGGLATAMTVAPNATLYLHQKALSAKYSLKDGQCRRIGMSRRSQLAILEKDISGNVVFIDKKTDVAGGLTLTGPVPRQTSYEDTGGRFYSDSACTVVDELLDDQSLFLECPKGIVVILGCAHSGIVNILDAVTEWTGRQTIYAVIGGMHLFNADLHRISETIQAFERYDIRRIVPLHCTGTQAAEQLQQAFADRCVPAAAGSQLSF